MKYYNNFRKLEDDEDDEEDFDDPGDIPPGDNREPQPPFPILYEIYPAPKELEIVAPRPHTLFFDSIGIPTSNVSSIKGREWRCSPLPFYGHKKMNFCVTGITHPSPFGGEGNLPLQPPPR